MIPPNCPKSGANESSGSFKRQFRLGSEHLESEKTCHRLNISGEIEVGEDNSPNHHRKRITEEKVVVIFFSCLVTATANLVGDATSC